MKGTLNMIYAAMLTGGNNTGSLIVTVLMLVAVFVFSLGSVINFVDRQASTYITTYNYKTSDFFLPFEQIIKQLLLVFVHLTQAKSAFLTKHNKKSRIAFPIFCFWYYLEYFATIALIASMDFSMSETSLNWFLALSIL